MKHTYSISALNNTVGIPPTSDGIMMMFCQAVAVANTFALDTAYLLTSMDDLTALGIDAAYDLANGTAVFQQVNDFYSQGEEGALLWLVGVATNTAYAAYVATNTFSTLVRFTGQKDPLNRAKMIGFCYAPPTALQQATDFPADVYAALTAIQTVQQVLFAQGICFCAIVDGYNMSSTVTLANLTSQQINTAFAVALCVTGTQPNGVSAVGLALGRFARISIGHGVGDLEDGPMATDTAYLTNCIAVQATGPALVVGGVYTVFGPVGSTVTYNAVQYTPGQSFTVVVGHTTFVETNGAYVVENVHSVKDLHTDDFDQLGQKQLFFLRTWQDYAGFYWNDGATCTSETKAFSSLEYNRCVNNLAAALLKFMTSFQGKNLPLDRATGNISSAWTNGQQTAFYTQSIEPLAENGGTGDITDGAVTITGINFLGTKKLKYSLKIIPTVILGGADGTVEFVSTL